jgi:endo-1,4-beta-mannosidase
MSVSRYTTLCRVLLLLALLLLAGCSTPSAPAARGPLPPITATGAQLMAAGAPFEVRGVNYIHPTGADLAKCPALQFGADGNCPWDLAPIAADLDRLQRLGVNTVRVFLNYYVFGGARATDPGYSMAQPLVHLDTFIAEANRRGIYVMPVLLAKYPQDRFGPDNYATALDLHVRPVVQHLAGRPGLLAWDVFNEPDIGSPVDIRCWDWSNGDFPLCFPLANERMRFVKAIHDEVKRLDPQRLVTVSLAFAKNYFEPAKAAMRLADVVDFYAFHYYDDDPYDSGRYAAHWYYGQGFPEDLRRAIAELAGLKLDKPIVVSELGFPTGPGAKRSPADLRRDLRLALHTVRNERTSGVILWPFQWPPEDLVGDLFTG